METVNYDELSQRFKQAKLDIPPYPEKKIYEEIENFQDYEYTNCIAYEMLIRTDEYNALLKQYDDLIKTQKSKNTTISILNELIIQMNQLGLQKKSFNGFDCDGENVFENIKQYDEILHSPWNVRTLNDSTFDATISDIDVFADLLTFYANKDEIYIIEDNKAPLKNYIKSRHYKKCIFLNPSEQFIPCYDHDLKKIVYKSLNETFYLKELDQDFTSQLKEKKKNELLIQIPQAGQIHQNLLNEYSINDIRNGVKKLYYFYKNNHKIKLCENHTENSKEEKSSDFIENDDFAIYCIPCIDVSSHTTISKRLTSDLPLKILEKDFLSTLLLQDLRSEYIKTEPVFKRPKLFLNEARLITLPINLNLSKEELIFYISKIKDDYDLTKNIVKTKDENYNDYSVESDYAFLPNYFQDTTYKGKRKRVFPKERKKLKKSIATAFWIYDLYKLYVPYEEIIKKKIELFANGELNKIKKHKSEGGSASIEKQIKADLKSDLNISRVMNLLSFIFLDLSKEQIEYYLNSMKEFIHGINSSDENNLFKKSYNPKKPIAVWRCQPKYKNLLIGNTSILKSNQSDFANSVKK